MKRIRLLRFTPDFFLDLCRNMSSITDIAGQLPDDAKVVPDHFGQIGNWSTEDQLFTIRIESAEFDEVAPGEFIPEHPIGFPMSVLD